MRRLAVLCQSLSPPLQLVVTILKETTHTKENKFLLCFAFRGRDRRVVGLHLAMQYVHITTNSWRWVLDKTLCDKVSW